MKKHHSSCIHHLPLLFNCLVLIHWGVAGQAQGTIKQLPVPVTPAAQQTAAANKEQPPHRMNRNTVKMNLSSLGLKNYHFTYERMLARKVSAALSYRTTPASQLGSLRLVKTGLEVMGENEAGSTINDLNRITAANKAYTVEFRFYRGRKPGAKGFYTGLFGRYAAFNIGYNYEYEDQNSVLYAIPVTAKIKSFSGGLQLGAQFNIMKHITVDLQLLGYHYGSMKGTAIGIADLKTLSNEEKNAMKREIEDWSPVVGKKQLYKLDAQVNNEGIKVNTSGPFTGMRAGISIGLAF